MQPRPIPPFTLVQIDPEKARNPMFAGCIMAVTESKPWGVQGYVQALGENGRPGGQAYYRAHFDEIEIVGRAEWIVCEDSNTMEVTWPAKP